MNNRFAHKRRSPGRDFTVSLGAAAEAVEAFEPGSSLCGFTKGQFSLIDLIKALLEKTGPAHVTVSTWTAGVRDTENVGFMLNRGRMLSFRLFTDYSFPVRQPAYCRKVLDTFGEQAIFCTRIHAKFAIIKNDRWSVVVRSSMNLNRNPRFEQFDVDDDPALCAFFESICAEIAGVTGAGFESSLSVVGPLFNRALGEVAEEHRSKATDDDDDASALLAELGKAPRWGD